jgi:lipopolysaccharide export system protein LptA
MFHATEIDVSVVSREDHYMDYLRRRLDEEQQVVLGSVTELQTHIGGNVRMTDLTIDNQLVTLGNAYFAGDLGVSGTITIDGTVVLDQTTRNDVYNFPNNIPFLYTFSNTLSVEKNLLVGSRDTPSQSNDSYFLNRVTMNSNLNVYGHVGTPLITNLVEEGGTLNIQAPQMSIHAVDGLHFQTGNMTIDAPVVYNSNVTMQCGVDTIDPSLIVRQFGAQASIAEFYHDDFPLPLLKLNGNNQVSIGLDNATNGYLLDVGGDTNINGVVNITNALKVDRITNHSPSAPLIFDTRVEIRDHLEVTGTTLFNDGVVVSSGNVEVTSGNLVIENGNVSIGSNLEVTGTTLFNDGVVVSSGNLEVTSGNVAVTSGNVEFTSGNVEVTSGNVSIGSNLEVTGTTLFNDGVVVASGNLVIENGNVSIGSDLDIVGNIMIGSNLEVDEHVVVNGRLNIGEPTENTDVYKMSVNGYVRASGYYMSSDERTKRDVRDLDMDTVINVIKNVRIRDYELINENSVFEYKRNNSYYSDKSRSSRNIGVVAQELEHSLKAAGIGDCQNIIRTCSSYVPNIVRKATYSQITNQLRMVWGDDPRLSIGTSLKVIDITTSEIQHRIIDHITKVNGVIYITPNYSMNETHEYVIYGTKENDVKSVDYTQLFCVLLKCVQRML